MHLSELDQRIKDLFGGYMVQAQQDYGDIANHSALVKIAQDWTCDDLCNMVARIAEHRKATHQEAVNLLHYPK